MTVFTAAELTSMRACQTAFMGDSCQIGTVSRSQSATGELIDAAASYGSELACGLEMTGGLQRNEFRTQDGTVVFADAKMRLPHGTALGVRDLVKVTKRQGTAITPMVYEVMGEPLIGSTGVVCYLRRVTA